MSPSFRESASLTAVGNSIYLYGGLGENIHEDIYCFDNLK